MHDLSLHQLGITYMYELVIDYVIRTYIFTVRHTSTNLFQLAT